MNDDLVADIKSRGFDAELTKNLIEIVRISVQAGKEESAQALTEARAEIERWAAQALREEDCREMWRTRALAAESELSTLRARASELAGENTNLRNNLVQRGMAEESLHEARCLEISDLIKTRLLGVAPDDQDLVLEDSDWAHIIQALERVAPCISRN